MRGARVKQLRGTNTDLVLRIMQARKCNYECAVRWMREQFGRGDQGQRPKFAKPHGASIAALPAIKRPVLHSTRHRLVIPR